MIGLNDRILSIRPIAKVSHPHGLGSILILEPVGAALGAGGGGEGMGHWEKGGTSWA